MWVANKHTRNIQYDQLLGNANSNHSDVHVTPTRTAITRRQKQGLMKIWRNWNPYILLEECKMVQPLQKTVQQFLKKLNLVSHQIHKQNDPAILLSGIQPREMRQSTKKKKKKPENVDSSILCNSQELETLHPCSTP